MRAAAYRPRELLRSGGPRRAGPPGRAILAPRQAPAFPRRYSLLLPDPMPQRTPPPIPRPAPSGPPARFGSCSRVLFAPFETSPGEAAARGVVEEIPYRRCPVGLIAAVDCPEFAGLACRHHDPRGERPKSVVPRSEVPMLAAELADGGYLTEAYRRRLRGLRVDVPPPRALPREVGAAPPSDAGPVPRPVSPALPQRTASRVDPAPVNVPSDDARRLAAAARRAARRAQGPFGPRRTGGA